MYIVKMGVLILIETNGKVKIVRYKNSLRAIEPIYSLLGFIFTVLPSRERERVSCRQIGRTLQEKQLHHLTPNDTIAVVSFSLNSVSDVISMVSKAYAT